MPAPPELPVLKDGPASYDGLDLGYDISYPQCKQGDRPLPGANFSVVGINNGRAFTTNPCFGRQWSKAVKPRSLYVNSGYYPPNLVLVGDGCRRTAQRNMPAADTAHRDAYMIGCGEAEHALGVARRAGADSATMWWIDVESSNSWDDQDVTLNRNSLLGEIERLDAEGITVGLYSSAKEWNEITRGWRAPWVRANWFPTSKPMGEVCAQPGFSGAPVWLVQETVPAPDPVVDVDHVCAATTAPSARSAPAGAAPPA